ncbi:hypothetical protein BDZ97DRAFT_187377 [Flammula alnicola]|nr:hypothetical protein BDZ97DRAFT_187377 [Flammula alnicola]
MAILCSHCSANLVKEQKAATSEPRCKHVEGGPCNPCTKLVDLDAQILEVEALLNDLKQSRTSLRGRANEIHNPLAHRVPVEVASHIFAFCIPVHDRYSHCGVQKNAPLILGAVCKTWRAVAWSTPQLWTSICIAVYPRDFAVLADLAEEWLARSGKLPLSIHLYLKEDETISNFAVNPLIEVLYAHSSRWRSLDLDIPSALFEVFDGDNEGISILDDLRIIPSDAVETQQSRAYFELSNVLPKPKTVHLSSVYPERIHILWDNVTYLVANLLHVDQCLEILRYTNRMERCDFRMIMEGRENYPLPKSPIILPHLRILHFDCWFECLLSSFINNITLPVLEQFEIDCGRRYLQIDDMLSFFARSASPLTQFVFENCEVGEEDLTRLLYGLPSLRELHLNFEFVGDSSLTDEFWGHLTTESRSAKGNANSIFLPNLESLIYEGYQRFEWETISDVLTTHCDTSRSTSSKEGYRPLKVRPRPLNHLEILLTDPLEMQDGNIIDEDILCRFLSSSSYGFALQICIEGCDLLSISKEHHGMASDYGSDMGSS